MKSTFKILSLLALLIVAIPNSGFADTPSAPAKTKQKYTPLYAQVDTVTDTLLTIKGTGADTKFVITAETKITKDKAHKEAAKATDAKPGQWVGGSYIKGADGTNTLHTLHLGVSQKGPNGGKPAK